MARDTRRERTGRLRGSDRARAARTGPDRPAPPFPVDVLDRGTEFVVVAELPGLTTQDLDLRVRTNRLQIVADYDGDAAGSEEADGRYLRRERERGEVSRFVRLPEAVDERHTSASYVDGVLRVHLRKRRRGRRVQIE